jgi:hypothetical protein
MKIRLQDLDMMRSRSFSTGWCEHYRPSALPLQRIRHLHLY